MVVSYQLREWAYVTPMSLERNKLMNANMEKKIEVKRFTLYLLYIVC